MSASDEFRNESPAVYEKTGFPATRFSRFFRRYLQTFPPMPKQAKKAAKIGLFCVAIIELFLYTPTTAQPD